LNSFCSPLTYQTLQHLNPIHLQSESNLAIPPTWGHSQETILIIPNIHTLEGIRSRTAH
jgi:hypothetical protein